MTLWLGVEVGGYLDSLVTPNSFQCLLFMVNYREDPTWVICNCLGQVLGKVATAADLCIVLLPESVACGKILTRGL